MGPITLTYDIVKFLTDAYRGEDKQAEHRARRLIWAVERTALSVFILLWMDRKRTFIESYQIESIPQALQQLLLNDFTAMGLVMAWGLPETRMGWGSWLIKQGVTQILNVIKSRRNNRSAEPDHFLYGILHISFGLFWYWMYNSENRPYLNTLKYMSTLENKAVRVLTSITT